MTSHEIIDTVRAFLTDNFLYTRPELVVGDHDPLMGSGIIDSMGVMELIMFVEETYGIEVPDSEITEANLGSLAAIASLVLSRQESLAAA